MLLNNNIGMFKNLQIKVTNLLIGSKSDFDFDQRFFNLACIQTISLLVISSVVDYIVLGFKAFLISFIGIFIFSLIYYIAKFKKFYKTSLWMFVVSVVILCNFSWFINNGSYGPTIYFYFIALSFFTYFTDGRINKIAIPIIIMTNICILMFYEYNTTNEINLYQSQKSRTIDLVVTFFYIVTMISSIILYIKSAYKEQQQISGDTLDILKKDIEKRKITEQKLLESEETARVLLNIPGDHNILLDRNLIILDLNETAVKSMNDKRENIIGKNIKEIIITAQYEYVKGLITNIIENKKPIFKEEFDVITNQYFEIRIYPITEKDDIISKFIFLSRDITERKISDKIIKDSLKEKEVLLKEVHHRVKNNLQIISSLLSLQARYLKDKDSEWILKEAQNRVHAMALIHQKLYQTENLSHLDMSIYISDLINNYKYSLPDASSITFEKQLENVVLDIDKAIVCGLVINELIINSIKYAFPDKNGNIKIELYKNNVDKIILKISDNGIGLPKGIDIENAETLGLNIVNRLIKSINGEINLTIENGTYYTLSF
ncbi:MAG: hypothetical protein A2X12_00635 [Bacteroidetes bacterium GWE2_29_8]|nr:MAG: hypothetical protein A2X12_00635 [Bacteroidetes bacterium GWE2_29_8]OFY20640.1 MAG: hypothetical protein A2X02_06155 [Bacteroidetes bacterium GWF2_29_10]